MDEDEFEPGDVRQRAWNEGGPRADNFDSATMFWAELAEWYAAKLTALETELAAKKARSRICGKLYTDTRDCTQQDRVCTLAPEHVGQHGDSLLG
jgi:hypothetical protein